MNIDTDQIISYLSQLIIYILYLLGTVLTMILLTDHTLLFKM